MIYGNPNIDPEAKIAAEAVIVGRCNHRQAQQRLVLQRDPGGRSAGDHRV